MINFKKKKVDNSDVVRFLKTDIKQVKESDQQAEIELSATANPKKEAYLIKVTYNDR